MDDQATTRDPSAERESSPGDDGGRAIGARAETPVGHSGLLAFGAILVLGLVLRLLGLGFLLPQQVEPDGNVFATQLELLQEGAPHPERVFLFGFYPTLIARVACLVPAPRTGDLQPAPRRLDEELAAASRAYVRLRFVVALLSLLIVPGTWLLARRFMGPGAALCSALLMATSVLDLWFSQQARPHAASAAFALLGVLAAVNLRRRGRPIDYVAAGLALGLAVGSLQSGIAVLLPIALAIVLRARSARGAALVWSLAVPASVLVFWLLFYPPFDSGGRGGLGGHVVYFELFRGEGFAAVWRTLSGYEPWILALAILGGVLALARAPYKRGAGDPERAQDLCVVLAYAIPYLVAIGLYARTYQRFVIPLLPYLACLAAYAIVRIAAVFGRRRTSLGAAVALVLLLPQVAAAFSLVSIRRARDTTTLAAEWLTEHLRPGADRIFVQYPLELPLRSTPDALASDDGMLSDLKHPWTLYQRAHPAATTSDSTWNLIVMPMRTDEQRAAIEQDMTAYLKGLQADYIVIDVYEGGRRPVLLNKIPPALREMADLVARFSPDAADAQSNLPIMYQDDEYPGDTPWLWRILRARCTGPVVEIYKLRKP